MKIEKLEVKGYEKVVHGTDKDTGLDCYIAVHSTKLGPSLGGCRIFSYDNDDAALEDVLRLSKGMTYKNSLAGLDLGGGKSVININGTKKTPELLFVFGQVIESLGGVYITAEDVGSTLQDMENIRLATNHVASLAGAGDPSPATALGVLRAIEGAVNHWRSGLHPCCSLDGLTVAVQGLGNVGYALSEMLIQKGAYVIATDINPDNCKRLKEAHPENVSCVQPNEIYEVEAEIFAPCAMGAIINDCTMDIMNFKIICGSANNQLETFKHGMQLYKRGIIYVPDYLANAGGVMNVYREFGELSSDFHLALMLDNIKERTEECLKISSKNYLPPEYVANQLAEERLSKQKNGE